MAAARPPRRGEALRAAGPERALAGAGRPLARLRGAAHRRRRGRGAPLATGPVDVLKLAHHGSEDAGLDRLLEMAEPALALISVGERNPYGHPSPATLASLADHGVPVLRTDAEGEIAIESWLDGWSVR